MITALAATIMAALVGSSLEGQELGIQIQDIGLMTLEEFLEYSNPGGKRISDSAYDWDLKSMNRPYLRFVGRSKLKSDKVEVLELPATVGKGFVLMNEDSCVAIIKDGVLYTNRTGIENRPFGGYFRNDNNRTWVSVEVHKIQRVKYPQRTLDSILQPPKPSKSHPVLLRNLMSTKGEMLQVRSESPVEMGRGATLTVFNEKGQRIASAQNEWGATLIAVAKEYRNQGIGSEVSRIWYKNNPNFKSGAFSSGGIKNAKRRWENRVRYFLAMGWYSRWIREGQLTQAHVNRILSGLGEKKNLTTKRRSSSRKNLLVYSDGTSFVLYDERFLVDPESEESDRFLHGYGFLRAQEGIGTFFYTLDYDEGFGPAVTAIAMQLARDAGEPLYVGRGYGDLIEKKYLKGLPVEVIGNKISLNEDVIDLGSLSSKEKMKRESENSFGQRLSLLIEKSESKWMN